jgi:cell division protein FtsQ
MYDLKGAKPVKAKGNRLRKKREPIDWKKLFRRGLRLGIVLFSFALIGGGAMLGRQILFTSDYFRITAVRVENNVRLGSEEVIALSEVGKGTNIFTLDLEAIGHKVSENPWIAGARVERVFPHEVVIRISERQVKAVINLGYLYYVDATGIVFKILEPQDKLDFPVLTGIDRKYILDQPVEARKILVGAVGLLDDISRRSRFSLNEVSELNYDQIEGFVLTTITGGVPIRLGFGAFVDKLDRLERIYPDLKPRLATLRCIDLNVADRVIVRVDNRLEPVKGKLTGKG